MPVLCPASRQTTRYRSRSLVTSRGGLSDLFRREAGLDDPRELLPGGLDALSEPAKSVVLCELDEARATRLYRPDPEALENWLKRYRGIGELRTQGYAPHVFREPMRTGT